MVGGIGEGRAGGGGKPEVAAPGLRERRGGGGGRPGGRGGSVPRLALLFPARWEGGEAIPARPARPAAAALTAFSSNLENSHIASNPSARSPASEKSEVINI